MAGRIVDKTGELRAIYASDGETALATVAEDPPALVVTDLLMPGMDGLQLVAALRERHPLVPVVLMTAHGSEETAVKALSAGAASYVPKRSLASELVDTVRNVLSVTRGAQDERLVFRLVTEGSLNFELDHDPRALDALVRHLETLVLRLDLCNRAEAVQIGVAVREALVNAVEHGNLELDSRLKEEGAAVYDALRERRRADAHYRSRRVRIATEFSPDAVRWTIRDDGEGFDADAVPDPTDPMNLDRVYGRGLLLIRTFMDEVSHNETGNEITMIKRRNPGRKREEG
ncbi:MAG TPA: response regulator [Polyangiaceae bacterium]|nr:response regulator [Polyangiaceae bacterium]